MPTTKTRVNVSLSNETKAALFRLARRHQVPHATQAARLIELALEMEEDQAWDVLAQKRERTKGPFVNHTKAWK